MPGQIQDWALPYASKERGKKHAAKITLYTVCLVSYKLIKMLFEVTTLTRTMNLIREK